MQGVRDSLLVVFSSVIMRLGALLASVIASRTVDIETLAEITTLLFGYQTFASAAVGGFLPLITNKIAETKRRPKALALNIDALYRVSGALAVMATSGFFSLFFFLFDNASIPATVLFGFAVFLNIHFHKNQATNIGFLGFGDYTKGNFIFSVTLLAVLQIMWVLPGPSACAAAYFLANAVATAYTMTTVRRRISGSARPTHLRYLRRYYLKAISIRSLKLMTANLFVLPSLFFLSLTLNMIASPLQTSSYNILMQWRSVLSLTPGAIAQAHLPRLSEKSTAHAPWSDFLIQYFLVSAVSLGVFYFVGEFLLSIYSEEIANNTSAIQALVIAMTFTLVNGATGQYLFVRKRYNIALAGNALWAAVLLTQVFASGTENATTAILALAVAAIAQTVFFAIFFILAAKGIFVTRGRSGP